ncbi:MAG: hypothetical protein ACHQDE_06345 [Acidimicrobiia bacterium]
MNLVGHVAVALRDDTPAPDTEFLVGCMLPDLAAIARVRLARPDGALGRGVAFHHACDEAFHESEWFRTHNRELRDQLIGAGIEPGPARACSHAGVEMLLDGALVANRRVAESATRTLDAVDANAADLAGLAPPEARELLRERLHLIGRSLDPQRYSDVQFVALRLHRMTSGRRRIELRLVHLETVSQALSRLQSAIVDDAAAVLDSVAARAPAPG